MDNATLLKLLQTQQEQLKLMQEAQARRDAEQTKRDAEFSQLLAKLGVNSNPNASAIPQLDPTESTLALIGSKLDTFHHIPDEASYFDTWYARHELVFTEDAKNLTDDKKVQALTR